MLDRQGIVMNLKKLRRLYREEKQTVRKRGGRKRALPIFSSTKSAIISSLAAATEQGFPHSELIDRGR